MPTYEYRCERGHSFEAVQRMTDVPLEACEQCGAPVQRVLHPVAVHFKGKGFYATDYGTARKKRELEQSAEKGADEHDAKMKEKRAKEGKAAAKGDGGESGGSKSKSNESGSS